MMWWHLIWPSLAALIGWGIAAYIFWDLAARALLRVIGDWAWLHELMDASQLAVGAAAAAAHGALAILLLPLVYATALFLVATVALPLMLERVAEREYQDLEERHGGSFAGSVVNTTLALVWYLAAWVVTLPLWLIPGVAFILPLLLSAYLNQRAFRYDALMMHADVVEMRHLVRARRGELFAVGLLSGALGYIPVVNLLAPAFAGLAFVHYCLGALREMRNSVAVAPSGEGGRK